SHLTKLRSPGLGTQPRGGGANSLTPRCELSAARSFAVVGPGHKIGGSPREPLAVYDVAVFECWTALGVAVMRHAQSYGPAGRSGAVSPAYVCHSSTPRSLRIASRISFH